MTDDVETLQKENSHLRSLLLYYQQHHRHCAIGRQPSPPPDEERNNGSCGDCLPVPVATVHNLHTAADSDNGLTIISFEPQSLAQAKQKSTTKSPLRDSQWRLVADQLIAKVPHATKWSTTRKELGLRSMEDNINVISNISGSDINHYQSLVDNRHTPTAGNSSDGTSASPQRTTHQLITLATNYAWKTKSSQVNATFACLLKSFQELIFTSLCAVLEGNGTDVALIDNAMRICISDSDPRNLKRLRHGAVWVNRLIADLAKSKAGWDCQRATEMVLFCGLSISKYGILAASSDSLAHLTSLLRTSNYTKAASGILHGGPFSIPALIKVLVGGNLNLKDICVTLHYQASWLGEVGQLFSWYESVLSYPEVNKGGTLPKKRKLNRLHVTGHEDEYDPTSLPRIYSACSQEQQALETHDNDSRARAQRSCLEWEGLESREEVDCNQSAPLQQLCEPVDTAAIGGNASILLQLTENRTEDIDQPQNAGNTLSSFNYNNACDLAAIAFDYDTACDLASIAFDYDNAFDLTSIAFIDDYTLSSFPNLSVLREERPTQPEPGVVLPSLQDKE